MDCGSCFLIFFNFDHLRRLLLGNRKSLSERVNFINHYLKYYCHIWLKKHAYLQQYKVLNLQLLKFK